MSLELRVASTSCSQESYFQARKSNKESEEVCGVATPPCHKYIRFRRAIRHFIYSPEDYVVRGRVTF